jgi:hypothetical protein
MTSPELREYKKKIYINGVLVDENPELPDPTKTLKFGLSAPFGEQKAVQYHMDPFRVFKSVAIPEKVEENAKKFMDKHCPNNDDAEIFINPFFDCHATGWGAENSIIAIDDGKVTITETLQPSRFFQYVNLKDSTYFITVMIVSGSAKISVNDVLIAENVGPGTHSYTLVNNVAGVYRVEFGTMSGVTTVFETCSLKELSEVQTPVAVGCGVPYGTIIASNELEQC